MTLIRTQQRALTSKLPHQANRTWAVPGGLAKSGNPIGPIGDEVNAVHFEQSVTPSFAWIPTADADPSIVNSFFMSLSLWFNLDSPGTGATQRIFELGPGVGPGAAEVSVRVGATNTLIVVVEDGGGATQIVRWDAVAPISFDTWYCVNVSLNAQTAFTGPYVPVIHVTELNQAYSSVAMAVNGAFQDGGLIGYGVNGWAIGSSQSSGPVAPANSMQGSVAEVWLDSTEGLTGEPSVDFNLTAEQAKFVLGGKPVALGLNGELPLSAPPLGVFKGSSMKADSSDPAANGSVTGFGWNQGQDIGVITPTNNIWTAVPVGAAVTDVGTV